MNVSVFGIGYVGITTAACLAELGHKIICVDVNEKKVKQINNGICPIKNDSLERLVYKVFNEGNLIATSNPLKAIINTDISLICVGTPTNQNGQADLSFITDVFKSLGQYLCNKNSYHLIIMRSTVPPGTTRKGLELVENLSNKKLGTDFGGCMNPEFLRAWSPLEDFRNPPFIIIGEYDKKSGDLTEELIKGFNLKPIRCDLEVAELIKYTCNAFHALKICFANEIGRISKYLNIDGRVVMDIFSIDSKLNISSKYLKPGYAFGGPCLEKDLLALIDVAKAEGINSTLLSSIIKSNDNHIDYTLDVIKSNNPKCIGILGISYHQKSNELHNSPIITLTRRLLDNGYKIVIYDNNVSKNDWFNFNENIFFLDLKNMLVNNPLELINSVDLIILAHNKEEYKEILKKISKDITIIDLVGLGRYANNKGKYEGICW